MAATTSDLSGDQRHPADAFPGKSRKRRRWAWVAASFIGVAVVSAALIGFGARSAHNSKDVGLEAAKAGFQLLVLAAAGLGVTGVLEWFSRQQDERRRVNEAAVELLRDLIDSYNDLKGTRRVLRALGLHEPQAGSPMSLPQREAFEREMRTLVEIQLVFERIGREIGLRMEEDHPSRRTTPQTLLARMGAYVKVIVQEWEAQGASTASGHADLAASMAAMPCLSGFLKHSRDDPNKRFRTEVTEPLHEIETFFRNRLIVPIALGDEPYEDTNVVRSYPSGGT